MIQLVSGLHVSHVNAALFINSVEIRVARLKVSNIQHVAAWRQRVSLTTQQTQQLSTSQHNKPLNHRQNWVTGSTTLSGRVRSQVHFKGSHSNDVSKFQDFFSTFQHHKHQKIRPTVLPLTTIYIVLIRKQGSENVT